MYAAAGMGIPPRQCPDCGGRTNLHASGRAPTISDELVLGQKGLGRSRTTHQSLSALESLLGSPFSVYGLDSGHGRDLDCHFGVYAGPEHYRRLQEHTASWHDVLSSLRCGSYPTPGSHSMSFPRPLVADRGFQLTHDSELHARQSSLGRRFDALVPGERRLQNVCNMDAESVSSRSSLVPLESLSLHIHIRDRAVYRNTMLCVSCGFGLFNWIDAMNFAC